MDKKNKILWRLGYLPLCAIFSCLGVFIPPLPPRLPNAPMTPFMPHPPTVGSPIMPMGGAMPIQQPTAPDDTVIKVILKSKEEDFNPFKKLQPAEKNKKLVNDFKIKEAKPKSPQKLESKKTALIEEHPPINNMRFDRPPIREPFAQRPFNNQYYPNNQYHQPIEPFQYHPPAEPFQYHPQYRNNMPFNNRYPHQEFRQAEQFNHNLHELQNHNSGFNPNNLPHPQEKFHPQVHEPLPYPQPISYHQAPREIYIRNVPEQRPEIYQNHLPSHPPQHASSLPQFHPHINENFHPINNNVHQIEEPTLPHPQQENNQHHQESINHENNHLDDVRAINAKKAEMENELKRLENRKKELIQQEAKKKAALEKEKAYNQEKENKNSHLNDQMKNAMKQIHDAQKPRKQKNEDLKKTEVKNDHPAKSPLSEELKPPKITIED